MHIIERKNNYADNFSNWCGRLHRQQPCTGAFAFLVPGKNYRSGQHERLLRRSHQGSSPCGASEI